jgi:hypothetical protein
MNKRIKSFQRQTSCQILGSLPIDIEEKRALRKNGLFTEAQLMKYRKWFDAMDADKSGSVNVEELSSVLLSSGIMKYKYEVENMFRAADADRSGEISFEEFVSGIGSTIAAGKLQLHRLDALVDETNVLSAETMLSQARREILMEHIIHQSTQRNAEIDKIANRLDSENTKRGTRRRQETICAITKNELKSHRSLDSLVGQHQLRRMKSMQTISNLSQILSAEISKKPSADYSFSPPSSSSSKPLHGNSSGHTMHGQQQGPGQDHSFLGKDLVPLESILHPSLWDLIDPTLRTFPDQVPSVSSLALISPSFPLSAIQLRTHSRPSLLWLPLLVFARLPSKLLPIRSPFLPDPRSHCGGLAPMNSLKIPPEILLTAAMRMRCHHRCSPFTYSLYSILCSLSALTVGIILSFSFYQLHEASQLNHFSAFHLQKEAPTK